MPRELVTLECSECKRRNYTTDKNPRTVSGRLKMNKHCPYEQKHTLHQERR